MATSAPGDVSPVIGPPATPQPILIRPSCAEVQRLAEGAKVSASIVKSEAEESDTSFDLFHVAVPVKVEQNGKLGLASQTVKVEPAEMPLSASGRDGSGDQEAGGADKPRLSKAPPFRYSFVEASLLLYSIFYAAVSRVPFTLHAIYMIDVLNFSYVMAALTLGLYCFGRLVGAHLAGTFLGTVTMLFGTASGAVAWTLMLCFKDRSVFILATFLLGFTETVTGLDTMLKIESLILRRAPDQTQIIFRSQLIFTCLGVFLAYMGGGFLYETRGMHAVGKACVIFSILNLVILCVAVFPRRRVYRQPFICLGDILAECQQNAPKGRKSRMSVAGKEGGAKTRASTYNIDAVEILDDDGNNNVSRASLVRGKPSMSTPQAMKTPFFLGCVVACFFFTTCGISTQFAISALYWKKVWGVNPDVVGTIMAIGECLGVCCLVFFGQPVVFNSPVTKFFGKPANVLVACLGMGFGCWLITINSKIVCLIATVGVHMFNVCVHSFQAELIGICASGESFGKWISISYVVKRAANCVCVFGSIVFFDAFGPQSSYRGIGSGLILYAAILGSIFAFKKIMPCQYRR